MRRCIRRTSPSRPRTLLRMTLATEHLSGRATMYNANAFKIGCSSVELLVGRIATTVPERWSGDWATACASRR